MGGAAGPDGARRLWWIAVCVFVARMLLAPAALFGLAFLFKPALGPRPLAFWAPAFIVASMPTANNMSTMADLAGSGRSISAASTAMQLIASPLVLIASLLSMLTALQGTLTPG